VLEKGSTSLASPSPLTGASTGLASIEVGPWLGPASTTGLATGAGCVGVEEGGGEVGRAESGGVAVGAVIVTRHAVSWRTRQFPPQQGRSRTKSSRFEA
jgi:hypothetical protein